MKWATCLLVGVLSTLLAFAQLPPPVLKAQVLVKVLNFVAWPAAALAPGQSLVICVAVEGALAQELLRAAGQEVQGHSLVVRPQWRNAKAASGCHVVVIGANVTVEATPGVLWVSEESDALERGGMLGLAVEDGRVVFDVGLDSARRAGLSFSARLLRLARFVRKD